MKKVTIDRNTWARGYLRNNSLYDSSDQKMCCLGFASMQLLSTQQEDMESLLSPSDLVNNCDYIQDTESIFTYASEGFRDSDFSNEAMVINDSDISEEEREEKLIKLFAENNIELEFIN